ncbi:hypothetical protein CDL12_01405 [Handroanthus impetiginosus]|uniref:Uncharacterized protein n=1 Tax=Handroanthus impetiginosus TaxID=429701 RepID=A0A2G9I7X2_9LAMI|nr:hypothetical protein CDL12_01405 [Handroanthus impetiginosus]
MGRKRKVQEDTIHGKEDNACSETATGQEKTYLHADRNSNPMDATNIENTVPYSNPPPNKINLKNTNVVTRRSGRLKNSVSTNGSPKIEPVAEHVNLVESEKEEAQDDQKVSTLPVLSERNMEEEATHVQQLTKLPVVNERNLEKKIDYIVQAVDEFKSETFEQVSRRPNGGPSSDLSYKSLYIDSQKKIEALMEKHYELVKMLEFANGKIDAYEKMHKAMAASKEVILVSRPEKDAEAISLSPRTVQGFVSAAEAGAPNDQNASPSNAADDHKVSPKQKKNNHKRKKAKSLKS